MKNQVLNALVASAFGLASAQAMATGFVNLPSGGFSITGGTTAYTLCNTSGDFGTDPNGTDAPTPSANNTCAIFPTTGHKPDSNYTKVLDTTRDVYMNNEYTGFDDIWVLTLQDEVWKASSGNGYIFANRWTHKNVDYDTEDLLEEDAYFEVNDFKRAGFEHGNDTARTVDIAYYWQDSADEAIFRGGRTRTGVTTPPGDERPLTGVAPLDANWVTLTTDTNYLDDDGTSLRNSPWVYFKTTINTNSGTTPLSDDNIKELAGAVEFYQAGQEDQPLLTVTSTAYAPWDADTN
jgi:hypothetical protein